MLDIAGLTLAPYEKEMIAHPNTGGVILFARNFENPAQLATLTDAIRAARQGNILIAVDQEGGRVQRFQTGFTRLPAVQRFQYEPEMAEVAGWLMASELLATGVDISFAPVLDIDCGISTVIGDRAFSNDAINTAQLASDFRQGMRNAGMAATGKHFPGHGAVALDSHTDLPIDERDLADIRLKDLLPFKQLIAKGLEAIMLAHVLYSQVDFKPAGFSHIWIQTILRQELGFSGVVFSDDLSMEGAAGAGSFEERATLSLEAGCDMILICNNQKAAQQVLEHLKTTSRAASQERLQKMLGQFSIKGLHALQATTQWQKAAWLVNDFYHRNR
jgi:beta-N-acetylhexosaminidase